MVTLAQASIFHVGEGYAVILDLTAQDLVRDHRGFADATVVAVASKLLKLGYGSLPKLGTPI